MIGPSSILCQRGRQGTVGRLSKKGSPLVQLKTPRVGSNTLIGMAFMLGNALGATGVNAIVRGLSSDLHPFEMAFFRCVFGLLVLAPMIFLSGVFTPTESIHPALADLLAVLPLRYYVDLATAVLFRGAGLEAVLRDLAVMAAIGAVLFALALARFRTHFGAIGK